MYFGSHTDAVVLVAADLVNVATPGSRQGRRYEPPSGAALSAALGVALRGGSARAADPLPEARDALADLGRRARPVFEAAGTGDLDRAVAVTNELLRSYGPVPTLARHDEEPWHLHFHGPRSTDPSEWGGGVAVGLATVLGSASADRLGVCVAPGCDRVFVDVSRNGTRRFCSLACQNRVKASTHRARRSAADS